MSRFEKSGPTYRDFVAALARFAPAPGKSLSSYPSVILAWGESDYLLSRSADFIRDQWCSQFQAVATSVEASEMNLDRFREMTLQTSLFDPESLYVIRRAERRADLVKLLATIPKHGKVAGRFLLLYNKAKIPIDLKREIERIDGCEVPCVEPGSGEINRFVSALARKNHIDLSHEAVCMLIECFGADLARLDNEVRKLSLLFPNRAEPISAVEVAPHVGLIREDEIFAIDNMLLQRDWSKAQLFMAELLNRGETPIAMLGLLARHCRNAIHVDEASNARGATDTASLASRLRLPFSVVRSYTSYVASTNSRNFRDALAACAKADIQLKSSRASDGVILSQILSTIAGQI